MKLLCCLKDKQQRRDCLSRADCYDQSSRRLTIKQPAELRRLPACFETTAGLPRDCRIFAKKVLIYADLQHGVQMFLQISRIPDLIQKS